MSAELFIGITAEVFSYALNKLDLAEKAKVWLKEDLASLAFQKALARAHVAFARNFPDYTNSFFDESFLAKQAAPELAKFLIRNQHPDPALLAQVWAKSLNAKSSFAERAITPISHFLKWLEAELKAEQVFQPLFDSKSLDSLPRIEAGLEELTGEIKRELEVALKAATEYEKIAIQVSGDIRDSNVLIGDGNQVIINHFYSGSFLSLRDFYEPTDSVFERVRVEEFVGRAWLTTKVNAFLNNSNIKSGAFLIEGEAGVGKSSFMAHLVKEERYLHLFGEQFLGDSRVQAALLSLAAQIVSRFKLEDYKGNSDLIQLTASPQFLQRLLSTAAQQLSAGEKIVIICDALDEAGNFPDGNVFGLPDTLPDGVYFILSQRPVHTKLPNIIEHREILDAQSDENLQDMESYLRETTKRVQVFAQLRAKGYSEATFIQTLKKKSLGVWMYLYYIILDIEKGYFAPLDLESLPTGLVGYYELYWIDWRNGNRGRGEGTPKWDELYAPLLTTLAAAQQPLSVSELIKWANVQATHREVTRLLSEFWSAFITERHGKNGSKFTPYHLSFRDFLSGRVDYDKLSSHTQEGFIRELADMTVEAHQRIVSIFREECKGNWEELVSQDYPCEYLSTHLLRAGEFETLRLLLTEGNKNIAWGEAKYKKEETYSGFLADLQSLWEYAEQKQNYALAIRCMLIENSIHSLDSNISPELLSQLAKEGFWSYARCLSTIRENSNAKSLRLIIPDLPILLFQDALSIAREINNKEDRAKTLANLAPHLNEKLKAQVLQEALSAAYEIENDYYRVRALAIIVPYLEGNLKETTIQNALLVARKISDYSDRAFSLIAVAPLLADELKAAILQDALQDAHAIKRISKRAYTLVSLVPHLSEVLRTIVIQEILSIALEIDNETETERAYLLTILAPYLDEEQKASALSIAYHIEDKSIRVRALTDLAPFLKDDLKVSVLQDALSVAHTIDSDRRAYSLMAVAPLLGDELKASILQDALRDAHEMNNKETDRIYVLTILATYLNHEQKKLVLQEALYSAREINAEYEYAHVLLSLVQYLPDNFKTQLLSAVSEIVDEASRVFALINLPPRLPEIFNAQLIPIVHKIKNKSDRVKVLAALIPFCNEALKINLIQDALNVVHEIIDKYAQIVALGTLLPQIKDDLKKHILQDALTIGCEIKDESERVQALTIIVPYLENDLKTNTLKEALTAAYEIKDESERVRALTTIVPYLENDLKTNTLKEALSVAYKLKNNYHRVRALTIVVPFLESDLKERILQDALLVARKIVNENNRADAITDLAKYFDEKLKENVLMEVRYIKKDRLSIPINYKDVLPQNLDKEELIIHLQNFLKSPNNLWLYQVFEEWEEIEFQGLEDQVFPFIKQMSSSTIKGGMPIVGALTPAIIHFSSKEFSSKEIALELFRTIQDVTRWWP